MDDWEAFRERSLRPLPACVRSNPLRISPDDLAARLRHHGLDPEPVPWFSGAFRLPPDFRPGSTFEYVTGLYAVQEEISLLPAALLDLAPGQRVLDLCAAPGSKTSAISAALGETGTVVANDRDYGRLTMVRGNLDRLGAVNVSVTRRDAANYPPEAGLFDRILADVPCTCEGTSRKNPEVLRRTWNGSGREKIQGVQQAILKKALLLCRPGGRVVYATCTYAPEENEAVVDSVLREMGEGTFRICPVDLPDLRTTPGLTSWDGRGFHPTLENAARIWPHHNDTGGFFVAVLDVEEATGGRAEREEPPRLVPEPVDFDVWIRPLVERFGLPPATFGHLRVFRAHRDRLGVMPRDHAPPSKPEPEVLGMTFLHTDMAVPKPTHEASQWLTSRATKNRQELSAEQAGAYLRRETFPLEAEQGSQVTRGYVLLEHDGIPLGLGFFKEGTVRSLLPKRLRLVKGV